jgi:hypothetical protein
MRQSKKAKEESKEFLEKLERQADKTKMKDFTRFVKIKIRAFCDDDADEQLEDMMGETWFDNWCSLDEEDLRETIKMEKYI